MLARHFSKIFFVSDIYKKIYVLSCERDVRHKCYTLQRWEGIARLNCPISSDASSNAFSLIDYSRCFSSSFLFRSLLRVLFLNVGFRLSSFKKEVALMGIYYMIFLKAVFKYYLRAKIFLTIRFQKKKNQQLLVSFK